jgi:hypothetical protein
MLIDFTWKNLLDSATFYSDGTFQFHGDSFDYSPGYWIVVNNQVVSITQIGEQSFYTFGGNQTTIDNFYHLVLAKMFFKENK